MLVGPGVESRVQLAAIDCRSVACVLEGQKHEVTREGPTGPRVSTKSGVSGVFPEWLREVRSSGELRSYRVGEVRRSESRRDSARQAKPEAKWSKESQADKGKVKVILILRLTRYRKATYIQGAYQEEQ